VLCLFDTLEQLARWQDHVDQRLPPLENNPDFFGEQFVVDETGDFIRRETRLLLTSADLSIEEIFNEVNRLGGLAIPAHVDRKAYGLLEILGFVPPDLPIEALEISRHVPPQDACRRFPQLHGYPLIRGGDVHRLDEFLGGNEFALEAPTVEEMRKAFRGQDDRKHWINCPTNDA
jgi:hypothetical protein